MKNKIPMNILINFVFVASFLFLCFSSSEQSLPIRLSIDQSIIFFSLIGSGFTLINFDWIKNIDLEDVVNVWPENMANYLNEILFGKYPYMFSIKPASGAKLYGNRLANLHAVRNKSFAEFFIVYFGDIFLLIIAIIVVGIPFILSDQQAPSYLRFVNQIWICFVIFLWLITVTWFSCLSILILRVRCVIFVARKLPKKGK